MAESPADLVSKLERAHSTFCESLVELGETDRLDTRPCPDEWTAREVAMHEIGLERFVQRFATRICAESDPVLDEDFKDGEMPPMAEFERLPLSVLVQVLESERQKTLELLAHSTDADLRRHGRTASCRDVTLADLFRALAGHEDRHTAQLAAILQMPVVS